ncbi:MAG: transaldolase family protein [Desulfomonilaceae bacterium]
MRLWPSKTLGLPLDKVSSVASFFLSRIDVLADPELEMIMKQGGPRGLTAASLRGEVAIASAKIAYQIYKSVFSSDRFQILAQKGARTQRVLWASTSAKDPSYSDVKYVEPLIGPETINTVPLETLNAYRDHGNPAPRLEQDVERAENVLKTFEELGIDLKRLTQQLEDEGVEKFVKPFDKLMDNLNRKRKDILSESAA